MRRVSCGHQRAAGIRMEREQAALRWLSLGRWRSTRACRARAPRRAGFGRSAHFRKALQWREASLPRYKTVVCDVRAVTSNAQPAFAWHANKRHCAGCLSGGGETRELAARARRAALVAIGLRSIEGIAPAEGLSLSAQGRGATCRRGLQRAPGIRVAREQAPLCLLSLGRWRNTQTCRARAPPRRTGCDRPTRHERVSHTKRPLSFGEMPWCDVRAVASNAHPAFAWHANKRQCAGCLSGGGKYASLPRVRAVSRWL